MPVTTRITASLVGNPKLNLYLPLLLGGGRSNLLVSLGLHQAYQSVYVGLTVLIWAIAIWMGKFLWKFFSNVNVSSISLEVGKGTCMGMFETKQCFSRCIEKCRDEAHFAQHHYLKQGLPAMWGLIVRDESGILA